MNLRRFVVLSAASLLLLVAYSAGCGDGSTGSLTGSGGGGGMDVCDGQFADQPTACTECIMKNCASLFTACCKSMYCENLANGARGHLCSGADCYGTAAMPGAIRGLIEDVDFGGAMGTPSPAWAFAEPLIACTVTKCVTVDPMTMEMKQICNK